MPTFRALRCGWIAFTRQRRLLLLGNQLVRGLVQRVDRLFEMGLHREASRQVHAELTRDLVSC